jgi:Cytochrome P460
MLCAIGLRAQQYTKDGELLMPKDYRNWTFLTSGFGMTYPEEGPGMGKPLFTNVFVQPAANQSFLRTGVWPDKTVLMLEVRDTGNNALLNKDGRFQTDVVGFVFHVKDASRRGWQFYAIAKGKQSGKAFPATANCFSCHQNHAASDTTFVQYYPTLIEAAKKNGTYKAPKE